MLEYFKSFLVHSQILKDIPCIFLKFLSSFTNLERLSSYTAYMYILVAPYLYHLLGGPSASASFLLSITVPFPASLTRIVPLLPQHANFILTLVILLIYWFFNF